MVVRGRVSLSSDGSHRQQLLIWRRDELVKQGRHPSPFELSGCFALFASSTTQGLLVLCGYVSSHGQ
jgi:hypothetical protein